ncbi:hypothetical protein B7P43_G12579 [Cryptotermes secundus]|uniref:Ubiquitin carboxyl-terminal hydrolase 36 n=1 Tax=Cryptotermes secundus TaxID=105785 RepID=A0A2J7Q9J9_9NEOP|nr:ubiquitin carboxyl-terminal hydrolase 36 isoform X2 [Cryptotermes secundus]PNF25263.1 hypothetical protein B7P43_G12579 [Cryptotermes secundus]
MPASGCDPVTSSLRLSLEASQGSEDNSLDKRLVASAARVLLTHIEYEPHGNCLEDVLNNLKNKCIVLRSQDIAKNGTDAAASSSTPNMPVSNIGSNQNGNMKPEPDSILPTPKITLFPAHDIQLGWRGTHCVGAGMINVGNTCYLNSTLQALFHVPAFINWLHSDNSHLSNCTTVVNGTVNGECIICAMNKTLKASQSKSGTIIKPFLIYNRLKLICKHLVHGQQEDAHEFMRYLLESMEKSYLTRYKDLKLDSYSKETTPLNQIFGGYIRTEVTCLQCGGVSTTFQHCQDLLLDIRRASTLDDALAAYFCKERLDGDDAYRCERCHRKVSATKKFSLEKPPQVLCIQFKRFSILGGKINKHVSFSLRLDLTRFLCPQSAHRGPVPLTYRLVSMVTHVGSSVHCGHYTAVAQTSMGHYYQFDDSSVRPISLSAVLDTNAYIMMYEREPKIPSVPQKSVVSAAATVATCTVNGQKTNLSPQGPLSHKIGSVVNHRQGCDSNSTVYTCASPLPSAKDRDRVVFGLHQPAVSPTPARLVMHIKNGKVYRTPPQPSPQRRELSASTAASSAASLVPYCESGEDESSSCDSEAAPRCSWDMPSLGEVSPPSQLSRPVLISGKVPAKTILERNICSSASVPTSGETANSSQYPKASCTAVGKSVQIKKSDTSNLSMSLSDLTVKSNSEVKSLQPEDICCESSTSSVSHGKARSGQDGGSQLMRLDIRNSSVSVASEVTSAEVRQNVDEEVTGSSTTVNTSVPSSHGKHSTAWQVTDLLYHSPSVASESSSSSNSFANSTTDWTVSDIKQKLNHISSKCKGPFAHKSCCPDSDITVNDMKLIKDESELSLSHIGSATTHTKSEGDSVTVRAGHVKETKNCDEEIQTTLSQPESNNMKVSDVEECNLKQYSRKREKKPKKLKKHKKKEKSAADGSEGSEATNGDEHESYEWVEKTHETLGISTTYQAQTNGHCWTGSHKPDVTNHLTHLSHRGYGSANVTNWSGERCHMDEELEHDRREDRKRNCHSAYDEEFDRGRVKKVKHHHSDSYHSKLKYNPFQEYHNYKHQWGNSNGGGYYQKPYRPYNHYSTYQPRHKQYAGRNKGYHNGNKFHNHYSKRDRWRQ